MMVAGSSADTPQPAQSSVAWRGVLAAVDDLEPDVVAGVQRHAESFGDRRQLWRDDELVGTVCGRCAHVGHLPARGPLKESSTRCPGNCATNRSGIVEFGDSWYFFYQNGVLPGGGPHRRSVCVDRLTYDDDGRINRVRMTTEGVHGAGPVRLV
jgi:hypothetical protein